MTTPAPSPFSYDPQNESQQNERGSRWSRALIKIGVSALAIAVIIGAGIWGWNTMLADDDPAPTASPEPTAEPTPEPEPEPEFDLTQHSIDDPSSIWLVVNKHRPLDPPWFEPEDLVIPEGIENEFGQPLREPAATAATDMFLAAQEEGVWFRIISAHRDYSVQESLYYTYGNRDGFDLADTYSARPGHSEHQTGLAIDFDDWSGCYLMECFGDTAAGIWLAENAADYGFIIRYPAGAEDITGFMAEPWHFRYVGVELAQHMKTEGIVTLEELFDLDPAPDYLE